MRHFISLAIFVLALGMVASVPARPLQEESSSTNAQATPQRIHNPQRQLDRLTQKLQLTPQQSTAIALILQHRAREIARLSADSSMDRHDRHLKIRGIKHDADQQMNAKLSDTQRQRYALILQKMQQRHKDKKAAHGDDASTDDGGH